MSTNSRNELRNTLLIAALLPLAWGCGDAPQSPLEAGADGAPVPGVVAVDLDTPRSDDGAVIIEVTGVDGLDAQAADGLTLFAAPSDGRARFALVGEQVSGELLTLRVPDVNRVRQLTVTVLDVADTGNAPRRDLAGYTARIRVVE